jgi:hypothetical protein
MLIQIKNIGDIFKGDSSILQKKPELCNISYGIDGERI